MASAASSILRLNSAAGTRITVTPCFLSQASRCRVAADCPCRGLCRRSRWRGVLSGNRSRARKVRSDVGGGRLVDRGGGCATDSTGVLPAQKVCAGDFARFRRLSMALSYSSRPAPPPPRFARFASSSGPPPPLSRGRKVYHAAFRSRSAFHWPSAARLFIMARWLKARCAAATFSDLPDQVFCGAACSARP
jgi:hypothetical protein